jgi:hypothetical protein
MQVITRQRIRRGVFRSITDLQAAIHLREEALDRVEPGCRGRGSALKWSYAPKPNPRLWASPCGVVSRASPHNTLDKASHGVGSLARRAIKGRRETAGAKKHSADLLARHVDCAEPLDQLCRVGERVAQDMKLNGLLLLVSDHHGVGVAVKSSAKMVNPNSDRDVERGLNI